MNGISPNCSQELSFFVSLPAECDNRYQGKGADVTFTFVANEPPAKLR